MQQTETVVQAALAVLERKEKIESAIQSEVLALSGLIENRLQADREFRRMECAAAIGEGALALPKAQKAAADARSALDQASLRVGGFRAQLGEQGTVLVEKHADLSAEIPKHHARIAEAFAREWAAVVSAFSLALGRRAAIEQLIGQPLNLPEPVVTPADLGDMAVPSKTLKAVEAAIQRIGAFQDIAQRPLKFHYDRSGVYKLTSDRMVSRGLPKGMIVVDASFEPGRLAQLIELEEARPVADHDIIPGVAVAAAKAEQIKRDAADRERDESERRLHVPVTRATYQSPYEGGASRPVEVSNK
jgi:hypothetical protein